MSDIRMGAVKMSGAVVDGKMSVGGGIRLGSTKVGGAIRIGEGGSAPTEARWGEITGNIQSQTDLMNALAAKADASALADYATDDELSALSETVSGKQDKVSGEDGQFLGFVNGVLQAVSLPIYNGGVN